MTVDFDRENMEFNEENEVPDEELEEDEGGRGRSPLRIILLILLILVLLCVLCLLGSRFVGGNILENIPGFGGAVPLPPPAQDTPTPVPTEEAALPATEEATPAEATEEAVEPSPEATEEFQAPTEQPIAETEPTEEAQPTEAPVEQPTLVVEPTDELVDEHGEEQPVDQPTPTTVAVPGPTATPGPTVVVTITPDCDNNLPPVADAGGPYNAMRGKGQAFVTFDGSGSDDPDGPIISYEWDFGDGSDPESGVSVTHGYTSIGSFVATLTVTDDCGATAQDTADVTIVGPTPPSTGTPGASTPTPTATPGNPAQGTLGFCYRVQYGDTLSGIAWHFGVSWQDLAFVNNVPMHYFVISGQGLFIPTGQITQGPNLYEVESGDTLNSVAFQCGLTIAYLAQVNGLSPNDSLTPGQQIKIPPWNYR